jgi:hypothetical protein
MSTRATVRIVLTDGASRIVVTDPYGREILRARLASARQAQRQAARTLLEALALFCNARLRVCRVCGVRGDFVRSGPLGRLRPGNRHVLLRGRCRALARQASARGRQLP